VVRAHPTVPANSSLRVVSHLIWSANLIMCAGLALAVAIVLPLPTSRNARTALSKNLRRRFRVCTHQNLQTSLTRVSCVGRTVQLLRRVPCRDIASST
jgi:hypothetical protein